MTSPDSRLPSPGDMIATAESDLALARLHAGHNLFLTGPAGTGKSTIIRRFLSETESPALVAAPTGIAALNIGGLTIHRLFGFRPGHTVETVESGSYHPGRYALELSRLHTLILDEISMARADVVDMVIAALERFGPDPGQPFGGVQLILVGDLYQLPPVVSSSDEDLFSNRYDSPFFFSAHRFRAEDFTVINLSRVFRQTGDPGLIELLAEIRAGRLLQAARDTLAERVDPSFVPPSDEFWLTLTTTTRRAAFHNSRHLNALEGPSVTFEATSSGELAEGDLPVDRSLTVRLGAQIMMVTNDPASRWVNGTMGRIVGYATTGTRILVELNEGQQVEVSPHTWEVTRSGPDGDSTQIIGTFTQLPCVLAWAVTIHKSQGQTLDRMILDLSGGAFAPGQLYVALSRCRSFDKLVLTSPVRARDLRTDPRVSRFLNSFDATGTDHRYCGLGVVSVGGDHHRSFPRPVELAVMFPDGTGVTTLINPQRDLGTARDDFGISAQDVLLAPTLLEAWVIVRNVMTGHVPVLIEADASISVIEAELRRLGVSIPLPQPVSIPDRDLMPGERARSRAPSARARAENALRVRDRLHRSDPGARAYAEDHHLGMEGGFLLSRDSDVSLPGASPVEPLVSAMREVGHLLLDICSDHSPTQTNLDTHDHPVKAHVWEQLQTVVARSVLTPELYDRLGRVAGFLGFAAEPSSAPSIAPPRIDELAPGSRVCFSGTVLDAHGIEIGRDQMEHLAEHLDLIPVRSVTKRGCDLLVVAEAGSQSVKTRKALSWSIPVIPAQAFLDRANSECTPPCTIGSILSTTP